jgi:AraC-like DNA-binding protein
MLRFRLRVSRFGRTPESYDSLVSDMVRGGAVHLEPSRGFDDPLVSRIASTIANEMESGFLDHILADALNTALSVQILRHYIDPSAITLAPSNGLSPERLRRVRDYIKAHLDDRLTLTDIAGVACLSPYHFSRSFKQAVGVGPQRYVIQRRLERAKNLAAAKRPAPRLDRAGGRLRRPKPFDRDLPPRDGRDTRPVSHRADLSLTSISAGR